MKRYRVYQCDYFTCKAPARSCLFCRNNTDVFWDFQNGPYAFLCALWDDLVWGYKECLSFADDGTNDILGEGEAPKPGE